ncbi:hypothetical protein E2C01_088469 [Portunus trituberculatus]|uniref:Uncharacterized protein n=1 Tax=Portunus trituberculatus TaxID=210409 RepID=A0A5B7JLZ4_PORTR|nr:hypothetical protein [Portunus trituberculatus]
MGSGGGKGRKVLKGTCGQEEEGKEKEEEEEEKGGSGDAKVKKSGEKKEGTRHGFAGKEDDGRIQTKEGAGREVADGKVTLEKIGEKNMDVMKSEIEERRRGGRRRKKIIVKKI